RILRNPTPAPPMLAPSRPPMGRGCAKPIEPPEEEFEGEQQDKDDRYGNSNLKHGKALLREAVHRFGPLLLRPKETCQVTGLGRVRNGQGQGEDQSGAGGKHLVQHRRSSASGARYMRSF